MRTSFVGRDRELAVLEECLASALVGRPRLVLCRGEPGIGKTRLVEELSSVAESADAVVVWGRAPEAAGAPPYWPWRQILRAVAENVDLPDPGARSPAERRTRPAHPRRVSGSTEESTVSGSAEDRFLLFDAVDRLLRLLSRERPLLVVFDDAHWADESSLLLLQHLADSMSAQRLLLVVTCRDTEPLGGVLQAGLARVPTTRTLEVRGLSLPDVGVQLALVLGGQLSDRDRGADPRSHRGQPVLRRGGEPNAGGGIPRALGIGRCRPACGRPFGHGWRGFRRRRSGCCRPPLSWAASSR